MQVLSFLLNLILFIFILGIIVLIHEAGHFLFAKKFKVLCHDFAIGMGPALFKKQKGETLYAIRAVPIGGYVSMAGESTNDAMFKKEDRIGLKLSDDGIVDEIILTNDMESDVIGKVVDFDLYGVDMAPLYIDLEISGDHGLETKRYEVKRDAIYQVGKKRIYYITPSEKSFESKKIWQRAIILLAGPVMNFVLALIVFLFMGFFVLKPQTNSSELGTVTDILPTKEVLKVGDVITSIDGTPVNSWDDLSAIMTDIYKTSVVIGYERDGVAQPDTTIQLAIFIQMAGIANYDSDGKFPEGNKSVVMTVQEQSRAHQAGLEPGDQIIKIVIKNGDDTKTYADIETWDEIINVFKENERGKITLTVARDGEDDPIELKEYDLFSKKAMDKLGAQAIAFQIGISPTEKFDLGYSLLYPFRAFGENVSSVANTLGLLFNPKEAVGVKDLSGFVGIFTLVGKSREGGFLNVIYLIGFLSINVGFINLLPIPALDGGRLIFLAYEGITRRKVNRKVENWINNIFFILLMVLMVYVLFNDIFRLI